MGPFGCYDYLSDQDYLGFNPLMRYLGQKIVQTGVDHECLNIWSLFELFEHM